jgi:hypothetical protein
MVVMVVVITHLPPSPLWPLPPSLPPPLPLPLYVTTDTLHNHRYFTQPQILYTTIIIPSTVPVFDCFLGSRWVVFAEVGKVCVEEEKRDGENEMMR